VDVRKLAKWNGMAPTDPLRAGRKLVVWLKQPSEAGILPPGPQKTRKIHYQVRQGDSLARISQKFRVGIQQLIEWNKLHGQKYLQPGQSLTLFVDVTRQSGI
jgi:membrane-bound lytic murein transglycosylase D